MSGLPVPRAAPRSTSASPTSPAPRSGCYLRGARLEATYPVSIPGHSMALNITAHSYAGTLDIGFIGDREALPHLQRLAVHTGEALDELEAAVSALRLTAVADVDQPRDAEAVGEHAELVAPHLLLERHRDGARPRTGPPSSARSASSSPLRLTDEVGTRRGALAHARARCRRP